MPTPRPEAPQASPPEDMWVKCPKCREIAFRKEVERNLNVCLKCGHHYRLTVEQRLAVTADRGTWRELHGIRWSSAIPRPTRSGSRRRGKPPDAPTRSWSAPAGSSTVRSHSA